jgi:hypothetical protein
MANVDQPQTPGKPRYRRVAPLWPVRNRSTA